MIEIFKNLEQLIVLSFFSLELSSKLGLGVDIFQLQQKIELTFYLLIGLQEIQEEF